MKKNAMKIFFKITDIGKIIKISQIFLFFGICAFICNAKADITFNPSLSYDLSAVPGELLFPVIQTRLAYNTDGVIGCVSESNDINGACNVTVRSGPDLGPSPSLNTWGSIKISLREKETNQEIHTTLRGYRSNDCDNRYPWDSFYCSIGQDPAQLHLAMDNNTLRNIPAGTWNGSLIMNQRSAYVPSTIGERILVNFTITVTDSSKQIIYFPAFPTAEPHVDLNLNYRPGSGKIGGISGSSSLDMCLYDGGTSAKTVQLLFQDQSGSVIGKNPELFSIYRDGADQSKSDNRIDYKLQVSNPTTGGYDNVSNGKTITWSNANSRSIQRNVVLPGISGVSLCLPAPLNFITPSFNYSEKNSGHYTGVLTVVYSISTR